MKEEDKATGLTIAFIVIFALMVVATAACGYLMYGGG